MNNTVLLLSQLLCMQSLTAGTLTIQSLPGSPTAGNPVCYNDSGSLSNCPESSLTGATVAHLSPVAVDSTGKVIGTLLDFPDQPNWHPWTLMSEQGYIFNFSFGMIPGPQRDIYYTTNDCAGQGYLSYKNSNVMPGLIFAQSIIYETSLPLFFVPKDATPEINIHLLSRSADWTDVGCESVDVVDTVLPVFPNDPKVSGIPLMYSGETYSNGPFSLARP